MPFNVRYKEEREERGRDTFTQNGLFTYSPLRLRLKYNSYTFCYRLSLVFSSLAKPQPIALTHVLTEHLAKLHL